MANDGAPNDEIESAQGDPIDAVPEDPSESIKGLPMAQQLEAEKFATEFIKRVIRLRGVRIDRDHFLEAELHRRGVGGEVIEEAIAVNPAAAGIRLEMLDQIAAGVVEFETRKSTAMSFAAGIPGGFAMLGTIPGDITQFYVHAFRIMQKVAYIYGWRSFLADTDEIDDQTLGMLAAFLGVMMGVGGASIAVTNFAATIARPAMQKQIAGIALTKTAWYTPMKQVLKVVGVKLTKDSFAKTVTKVVPVAGGVISGGLTYATLRVQAGRLVRHLRELPPPGVDAEAYLAALHAMDEADTERAQRSMRGRVVTAAKPLREPSADGDGGQESDGSRRDAVVNATKGAGSAAKGVAASVGVRVGSLLSRRKADDAEVTADDEA